MMADIQMPNYPMLFDIVLSSLWFRIGLVFDGITVDMSIIPGFRVNSPHFDSYFIKGYYRKLNGTIIC